MDSLSINLSDQVDFLLLDLVRARKAESNSIINFFTNQFLRFRIGFITWEFEKIKVKHFNKILIRQTSTLLQLKGLREIIKRNGSIDKDGIVEKLFELIEILNEGEAGIKNILPKGAEKSIALGQKVLEAIQESKFECANIISILDENETIGKTHVPESPELLDAFTSLSSQVFAEKINQE